MKLSIIIPTFNNLDYLKFFLRSLKINSTFDHEIILHINDGSDGTLKYALDNKELMSEWKSNTHHASKELNWEIEENTLKDLYKKIEE